MGTMQNWVKENWNLSEVVLEKTAFGTSSGAQIVRGKDESYILRRLSSHRQGIAEYRIAELLSEENVSPKILRNCFGESFSESDGTCYNLQEYISGNRILRCDEQTVRLTAESVAKMHRKLSLLEMENQQPDRFSLSNLMKRCEPESLESVLTECKIDQKKFWELCRRACQWETETRQWIHGDLGIWNFILTGERAVIIDFGECRKGSIYFDLAAVLTSLLSKEASKEQKRIYFEIFENVYEEHYRKICRKKLLEFIQLWYLRGLFANAGAEDSENRMQMIRIFARCLLETENFIEKK